MSVLIEYEVSHPHSERGEVLSRIEYANDVAPGYWKDGNGSSGGAKERCL